MSILKNKRFSKNAPGTVTFKLLHRPSDGNGNQGDEVIFEPVTSYNRIRKGKQSYTDEDIQNLLNNNIINDFESIDINDNFGTSELNDLDTLVGKDCYFPLDGYDYNSHLVRINNLSEPIDPLNYLAREDLSMDIPPALQEALEEPDLYEEMADDFIISAMVDEGGTHTNVNQDKLLWGKKMDKGQDGFDNDELFDFNSDDDKSDRKHRNVTKLNKSPHRQKKSNVYVDISSLGPPDEETRRNILEYVHSMKDYMEDNMEDNMEEFGHPSDDEIQPTGLQWDCQTILSLRDTQGRLPSVIGVNNVNTQKIRATLKLKTKEEENNSEDCNITREALFETLREETHKRREPIQTKLKRKEAAKQLKMIGLEKKRRKKLELRESKTKACHGLSRSQRSAITAKTTPKRKIRENNISSYN